MISSTPASASPFAIATVFAVGTTPSIEQPNAVDITPATSGTLRGCAFSSQPMISRISSRWTMDCSGMRFRLAMLWPSLTETGMLILCTPAL